MTTLVVVRKGNHAVIAADSLTTFGDTRLSAQFDKSPEKILHHRDTSGKHPQPGFGNRAPEKVEATITPDLLFEAHSSILDLVFYDGDQFPPQFKGHAFVALKGSWNRSQPTGYKVVRVPSRDGKPEGYYENFMVGFWASGELRAEVWGRPAALAVMKDGSLLVADDTGGTIWRVSYTGSQKTQ